MIYQKKLSLLNLVMLIPIVLQINACSSSAYRTNSETLFQDQQDLKMLLENIVDTQENYSIKPFARRTQVSVPLKQTKLFTHSFYLLVLDEEEYHTLSFSSTKSVFYPEGAWVLDKKTDMASYNKYIEGKNKWKVTDLFVEENIDSKQTLINVINSINSGEVYYYRDHIRHKPNALNCNTALYKTLQKL